LNAKKNFRTPQNFERRTVLENFSNGKKNFRTLQNFERRTVLEKFSNSEKKVFLPNGGCLFCFRQTKTKTKTNATIS
jgi:hypothetical protein